MKIVSSGDLVKDGEDFLNAIIKKFNIGNAINFKEECYDYFSKIEELKNKEMASKVKDNKERANEITNGFFKLIDKYTKGFDYIEGAKKEADTLVQMKEKLYGN